MLRMDIPLMMNPSCLRNIERYLVHVQVLDLHAMNKTNSSDHDLLLDVIARNGSLQRLVLRDLDVIGDWFEHLQSLNELTLVDTTISSRELFNFLQRKPRIRRFTYKSDDDNAELIDAVCANCPDIETLLDYHKYAPSAPYTHRYRNLSNLRSLRRIAITTHTAEGHDIDATLLLLCQRNTVQTLVIATTLNPVPDNQPFFAVTDSRSLRYVDAFTRLTMVCFYNYITEHVPWLFYKELLRRSNTIKHIVFRGKFISIGDLTTYAMHNPKTEIIDVSEVECENLVSSLKSIGDSKELWQKHSYEEVAFSSIRFVVSEKQYALLNGHKFHSLLSFSLQPSNNYLP